MRPTTAFRGIALALLLTGSVLPSALAAQPEPPLPGLPRGADPNDWEAYFELGDARFQRMPRQAAAAFYWASRMDPTRAEPLFARWAVFYAGDAGNWLAYLDEDATFLRRPDVIRNDSLLHRALQRNPFVHRGLEAALYGMLGRRLRWDGATLAFMEYARGDYGSAAARFESMVRASPERNLRFRHWRALSLVGGGDLDAAVAELTALVAGLRASDEARVTYVYESKAMLEYAVGMLHDARGRPAEARRAFERALEEDLSTVPARVALGRLARRGGRAAEAVEHTGQATALAPDDGVIHFEHGLSLTLAGEREAAIEAFRRAIHLEPHWADPYYRLGTALDLHGAAAEAAAAYGMYLERAPRRQSQEIARARERVAALRS